MKRVRITVKRITHYEDLSAAYELPLENPCPMKEGEVFYSDNAQMPEGFCSTAFETLYPFIKALAEGQGHFYGEWMKDPYSALISCNDGFRPVSFLLEVVP